jgi:hypothetical protein
MRFAALALPWLLAGCVIREVRTFEPARDPVNVEDIVYACRAKADQGFLIREVQANGVSRSPSAEDVIALQQSGAGDALIRTMIEAPVVQPRPARETYTVYREVDFPIVTPGIVIAAALWHHHEHWSGPRVRTRCRW